MSAAKCGWDLSSYPPAIDGKQPDPHHIEVKGRVKGASTVTITRNEMLYAFNQGDKFVLAIALVGEDDTIDGPQYIRNAFDREAAPFATEVHTKRRREASAESGGMPG